MGGCAGSNYPFLTLKERDIETGLDFFEARYNASIQGRFTSPDSFGGSGSDPQTLNLYTYVVNSPLRYNDPTGHMAMPTSLNPLPCVLFGGMGCNGEMFAQDPTKQQPVTSEELNMTKEERAEYERQKARGDFYGATEVIEIDEEGPPDAVVTPLLGGVRSAARGGPPNGYRINPKAKQIRYFDGQGLALRDDDWHAGHDSTPHVHDWDWTKTPPRQDWRAPNPGEGVAPRGVPVWDDGEPVWDELQTGTSQTVPLSPFPIDPVVPRMPMPGRIILPRPILVP